MVLAPLHKPNYSAMYKLIGGLALRRAVDLVTQDTSSV